MKKDKKDPILKAQAKADKKEAAAVKPAARLKPGKPASQKKALKVAAKQLQKELDTRISEIVKRIRKETKAKLKQVVKDATHQLETDTAQLLEQALHSISGQSDTAPAGSADSVATAWPAAETPAAGSETGAPASKVTRPATSKPTGRSAAPRRSRSKPATSTAPKPVADPSASSEDEG